MSAHVGPAVLNVIDSNQYGGIPKSSMLLALTSMLQHWSKATDGTGAAIRVILSDYRKAFDLIDHNLLIQKILDLDIPGGVSNWMIDFLCDRKQRVKLLSHCLSEWGPVPAGVPQDTKLGPWLFILMINDLKVDSYLTWKYVDDTTVAVIVRRGDVGTAQRAVSTVAEWTVKNNMQLNADKCKELIIDFKKNIHNFSPLTIESKDLPVVTSAKILGVTISDNLKWNDHVLECVKKANKQLFFIVKDILDFYCCSIRSVLEYCAPVYRHTLPAYLSEELQRVQKRVIKILATHLSYSEALTIFGLTTLKDRRSNACIKFFTDITNNPTPKLNCLLPPVNPLRPNNDPSQTSHCNIKALSVSEVMRIENMITQVQVY